LARKKRSIPRTLFILFLVILGIANIIYYVTKLIAEEPQVRYPEFGIYIPPGYALHGIDVSRYQKTINWEEVKNMEVNNIKIGFAFIKATEGLNRIDPQFNRNWLHAQKENIPKGAYHFFIAGKSGKQQAENFIEIVKLKRGDLPPVIDVEESYGVDKQELQKNLADCIKKIEEYYKIKPILYTNISFYNNFLKGDFDEHKFWIAHYSQPGRPRIERKWSFWQHSEKGRVNGIRSMVDFNVFSGDSTDFDELLLK